MRLRRRLMFAMAVLLVIGLAISDVVTYTSLRSFLYGRLDSQLVGARHESARLLRYANSHVTTRASLRRIRRISPEVYVIVLASTGRVLVTRPPRTSVDRDPGPVIPRSVRLSRETDPRRGPYRPNPYNFTLAVRNGTSYRADATRVSQGTLIVAVSLSQTDATMTSLVRIEIGVSAAVLLALCVLALWIVRRGLRPLDDMAKTAGEIASGGDLGRRIDPADTETEVGRLGSALNTMLARIEDAFAEKSESEARLRQFVADASHELRTPLTSIRGYAELLRKGAFVEDEERKRALRRVEREASRMSGLVEDLLLLARLDQGRPLERTPVDLRRVCRDAVDDAQLTDSERRVTVVAPVAVTVAGDRDRLAQVAHNLVQNALVHTAAGSPVRVEVVAEGRMGVLRVVDQGPGLTASRRARVFDRFYRGDPSRTGEGTGLGLSIVRAIAEALGGRAWVEARADRGGTVFGVEVPLAPATEAPPSPATGALLSPAVLTLSTPAAPVANGRVREPGVHAGEHRSEPTPDPDSTSAPESAPAPAFRGAAKHRATTRRGPDGA